MATVYLARDLNDDRPVAVKVLRPFSRNLMLLRHTQREEPGLVFLLAGKRRPPDVVRVVSL